MSANQFSSKSMGNKLMIAYRSLTMLLAWLLPSEFICNATGQLPDTTGTFSVEQAAAILIRDRCLSCHNDRKAEGGYNLSRIDILQKPGDSGKIPYVVNPSDDSELIKRITSDDETTRMPSEAPQLSEAEISLIRSWMQSSKLLGSDDHSSIINLAAGDASLLDLTKTPKQPSYPNRVPRPVFCLDSNHQRLYVGGIHEVIVWDSVEHCIVERWTGFGRTISTIERDVTGNWIAVASGQPGQQGAVHVVRLDQSQVARLVVNLSDVPVAMAFSPIEPILAIGGLDGSIMLFDVTLGTRLLEVTAHADQVLAMAWKSDGSQFMSGSRDRTARVYDFPSIELRASYSGHERSVGSVGIVELGAITLDETGTLRLWSSTDSDRVLAKRTGLPQRLQPLMYDESTLSWLDDRRIEVALLQRRDVEEGRDDSGKPKIKKIHEFVFSKSVSLQVEGTVATWTTNRDTKELLVATRDGWVYSISESTNEPRWRIFP